MPPELTIEAFRLGTDKLMLALSQAKPLVKFSCCLRVQRLSCHGLQVAGGDQFWGQRASAVRFPCGQPGTPCRVGQQELGDLGGLVRLVEPEFRIEPDEPRNRPMTDDQDHRQPLCACASPSSSPLVFSR